MTDIEERLTRDGAAWRRDLAIAMSFDEALARAAKSPATERHSIRRPVRPRLLWASVAAVVLLLAGAAAGVGVAHQDRPVAGGGEFPTPTEPAPIGVAGLRHFRWSTLPSAPIAGRSGAATVWTGTQLLVWGGGSSTHAASDGAAYTPSTRTWTRILSAPGGGWFNPAGVWTGHVMIVWSNNGGSGRGQMYDPRSRRWTVLPAAPDHGSFGEFAWVGDRAVLTVPDKAFAPTTVHVDTYDPASNSWSRLPDIPVAAVGSHAYATPALVRGRLVVWVPGRHSFRLDRDAEGWTQVPYSPEAAGCVYQAIPTATGVVFPPTFRSISCGGDLAFAPGIDRGAALDTASGRVTQMPYNKLSDSGGVPVWTGDALVLVGGATAAWDLSSNVWAMLPTAPAATVGLDGVAAWVWTGRQLIGFGDFRSTQHPDQHVSTLVFGPTR